VEGMIEPELQCTQNAGKISLEQPCSTFLGGKPQNETKQFQ